jgi:hypothetical protein
LSTEETFELRTSWVKLFIKNNRQILVAISTK